jgi:hypothetical protein
VCAARNRTRETPLAWRASEERRMVRTAEGFWQKGASGLQAALLPPTLMCHSLEGGPVSCFTDPTRAHATAFRLKSASGTSGPR